MNKPRGTRVRRYPKFEQFWRNVDYLKIQSDMTVAQVSKVLSITSATYTNRHNKPEHTTGGEITRAAKFFGISEEQMLLPLVGMPVTPHEIEFEEDED